MARGSIGSEQWRRAWQRESRLLTRVRRAAWRREMAELERTWASASAHAEGVSACKIATAAGLVWQRSDQRSGRVMGVGRERERRQR